jgi:hypothetical protein
MVPALLGGLQDNGHLSLGIAELLNSWDLVSNALQRLITRDNTLSRERRLSGSQCKTARPECAAACRLYRNSTGEPRCFSVEGRRGTTSHLAIVRGNEAI